MTKYTLSWNGSGPATLDPPEPHAPNQINLTATDTLYFKNTSQTEDTEATINNEESIPIEPDSEELIPTPPGTEPYTWNLTEEPGPEPGPSGNITVNPGV